MHKLQQERCIEERHHGGSLRDEAEGLGMAASTILHTIETKWRDEEEGSVGLILSGTRVLHGY